MQLQLDPRWPEASNPAWITRFSSQWDPRCIMECYRCPQGRTCSWPSHGSAALPPYGCVGVPNGLASETTVPSFPFCVPQLLRTLLQGNKLQRSLLSHERPKKLWATTRTANSLSLPGGEKYTRSGTASDHASSRGGGGAGRGSEGRCGGREPGAARHRPGPPPPPGAGRSGSRGGWRVSRPQAAGPSRGAASASPPAPSAQRPADLSPSAAPRRRPEHGERGGGAPRPRGLREGRGRARPGGSPRTALSPAVPPSCERGAAWAAARAAPVTRRPVESGTVPAAGRLAGCRPAERAALALRGRSAARLMGFARLFSVTGVVSAKSHACGFLEDLLRWYFSQRFCFAVCKGAGSDTLTGCALPLPKSRLRGESGRRPVKPSLQMTASRRR